MYIILILNVTGNNLSLLESQIVSMITQKTFPGHVKRVTKLALFPCLFQLIDSKLSD